jgi:hypothetical protein
MQELFARALLRDQAGVAFGSAAVLRPAGSPLMPLRRTPHQPDLAGRLVRNSWLANFRQSLPPVTISLTT